MPYKPNVHIERWKPTMPYGSDPTVVQKAMRPQETIQRDYMTRPLSRVPSTLSLAGLPDWATNLPRETLAALLLVGQWTPTDPADEAVLQRLGCSVEQMQALCQTLCAQQPPKVILAQSWYHRWDNPAKQYAWVDRQGTWWSLAGILDSVILDRFAEAAIWGLRTPEAIPYTTNTERDRCGVSPPLRTGLAQSLALLGHSDSRIACDPAPSLRAAQIVTEILLPETASTLDLASNAVPWAVLQEVLPLLAEAAPEVFLAALTAALEAMSDEGTSRFHTATHDDVAKVRAADTSTVTTGRASSIDRGLAELLVASGGLLLLGQLCRALETLAWNMECLEKAALLLANLARLELPPADKPRHLEPLESLRGIFSIGMPQTCAPIDERLSVLQTLCSKVPSVAWRLLLKLLPRPGFGRAHDARKPWVPWLTLPYSRGLAYQGEGYGQVETFLALACELAGTDGVRWAALLDKLPGLPEGLDRKLLTALQQVAERLDDPMAKTWAELDHQRQRLQDQLTADHHDRDREPSGSNGDLRATSRPSDQPRQRLLTQLINPLIDMLIPEDPLIRLGWLFRDGARLRVGPHDEDLASLANERQAAIAEISQRQDCWNLLARMAATSDAPASLATALAESPLAEALVERLRPPASFEPFEKIASRFWAVWLLDRPFVELDALVRSLVAAGRVDDATKIISQYGFTDKETQLWDLLDALGEPLRGAYWRSLSQYYWIDRRETVQHLRAMRCLLQYHRLDLAVRAASMSKPPLPTDLQLDILQQVVDQTRPEDNRQLPQVDDYLVKELLRRVNPTSYDEQQRAVLLEFALVPQLARSPHTLRFVPDYLTAHPEFFVALVRCCADRAPVPELRLPLVDYEYFDDLLSHWSGYPGSTLGTDAADDFLLNWCRKVLAQLNEPRVSRKERELGLRYLAELLKRPVGTDGRWPSLATRRLLQDELELEEYLFSAKRYAQGVTMRSGTEGGEREHGLARQYDELASQLAGQWPVSGRLLSRLANSYENEAQQRDETAASWSVKMSAPKPQVRPLFPLTRVQISQFRAITKLDLMPHRRLTLLFGKNASGKSSVLDAIAVGLAAIGQLLPRLDASAPGWQRFAPKDLRKHRQDGKEVTAKQVDVQLWGQPQDDRNEALHWQVSDRYAGRGPQILDRMTPDLEPYLSQVGEALRTRDRGIAMPVFAHYGVERAVSERAKDDARPPTGDQPREVGLWGALVSTARFEWAVGQFRLLQEIEKDERDKQRNFDYRLPRLQIVREAISATLKTPDGAHCDNPRIEPKKNKMVVDYVPAQGEVQELEIGQLSDGFRTHLALVMDLALRMVICNPPPEDAGAVVPDGFGTRSYSVVLLDEIDLHLHPSWQHTVLLGLLDAFPNTQFFVTTHSEQVLASIDDQEEALVLMLEQEDGDVKPSTAPMRSFGARSQDILSVNMDTPERPNLPITAKLKEYMRLVDGGQGRSEMALQLRAELDQKLDASDATLVDASVELDRQQRLAKQVK